MKTFGLYILLSILTGNPFLALVILLLIFFFAERRFVGILPDIFEPWRRANRIRQLKQTVRLNPADAEAFLELGENYFRRGNYRQAMSFLKNAHDKMSGHPLLHFFYGASAYHMGKTDEGKKEMEKAVELNPKAGMGEPYTYLIKIYLEEKQPGENIERLFNQLLKYGSPRTFYQGGKVFLSAGDKERARRLFRETIESYEVCRGALRRMYRRWAILSKISLLSIK